MFLNRTDKWNEIKNKAEMALKSLFPLTVDSTTLELSSVEFKDPIGNLKEQREALIAGETLASQVYGRFVLKKDGKGLDTARIKLMDLPITTHRGTYVVQGKDYNVFNQMRLRPGVYTQRSEASDTVSSRFNLAKGLGFKVELSSDASVFYVVFEASKRHTGGQTKVPLYSLIRILGGTDDQMKHRWGAALFESNKSKSDLVLDTKTVRELVVYETKRTANEASDVKTYFEGTQMDPEITAISLGTAYNSVTAGALLDASAKMVKVYKNEDDGDDLDSLLFKEILSAEDHIFLRITKGAKELNGPLAKIRRKLRSAEKVSDAVPSNMFTKLIEYFFTTSSLASPQTEINPVEILETNHKITAMGEGGIQSEHSIPMSARNLHASHFGFFDPIRTTESMRVGVDLRMTSNSHIKDRKIYAPFIDRSGKHIELTPQQMVNKVIGFAGQSGLSQVKAMKNGNMLEVKPEAIDYWMEKPSDMFTFTTSIIPFMHNNSGNRVNMSSRMLTQSLPLVHREVPGVQVKDGDSSIQKNLGSKYFVAKSPIDGVVEHVTPSSITIGGEIVELYSNFPLNVKSSINMEPCVKLGERVKRGQVVAESNYTKDSTLALGVNVKAAYIPYHGWNHEDGIVISETAAKKFTSDHLYAEELVLNPSISIDKHRFSTLFPMKITPVQLRKLDEKGVVKEGQVVHKGDYLVAALQKREATAADVILQKMHSVLANPYKDVSILWDHDTPGTVTDVLITPKLIKIYTKAEDIAVTGDKLVGNAGNKGTISKILPDNEMPYTKDGPVDILLNPAAVISRINPGQLYEAIGGKIAQKTGKPYIVENFSQEDMSKKVLADAKKHGVDLEEPLYDSTSKKKLGEVFVGNPYFMKLMKQTASNYAARATKGYDVNLQPSKGGEEGAKAVGMLDLYALLGHNARHFLHETASYKSQKNDEFWDSIKLGLPLPPAKEPFAFEKFKAMLGTAGIKVTKDGHSYQVSPLTDKHILAQSSGEVHNPTMMKGDASKMTPEKGGLFDSATLGGSAGKNWGHIELAEPIVNPMFHKIVKVLLDGEDPNELNGAEVRKKLAEINVPERITAIKRGLAKAKGTNRDKLLKEYRYLSALNKLGMHPKEYVLSKFPIMPPVYRPIYPASDGGTPMVSDLNHLYRDLILTNTALKDLKDFPDKDKKELRKNLFQSAGAVIGVTDPVNVKSQKQQLKGALKQLSGETSKEGFFHRKLLYRPTDSTGRGTILPDPNLHVDEAGIPKEMCYELFKPFMIRNLVRKGLDPVAAAKEVLDKTHNANTALMEEIKDRPIILNRAPTLWKLNMMAFKPIPIEGKSIFIPPLVNKIAV